MSRGAHVFPELLPAEPSSTRSYRPPARNFTKKLPAGDKLVLLTAFAAGLMMALILV